MNTAGLVCRAFEPGPGDRVKWSPERKADWAGPSVGAVVGFEAERLFFGADSKPERPTVGPAYEVLLDGPHRHRVWVDVEELFAKPAPVLQ